MFKAVKMAVPAGVLVWMMVVSTALLFLSGSLRHALFHSNAWDLGIFDQPLYLLSQGLPPISSIIGVHILGDHAAWIFYPLSLLYRLYPSVYWLFAVQAIALSLGTLPTWHLARQAGLKETQATEIAAAYLLYPLLFNLNLFDFHPEVIALPLMLTAIWAARADRIRWFMVCILIVLGCRDALSLTVAAMGVWLWGFEKRRWYGAIALGSGIPWLIIATQLIIPHYQPEGVLGLSYYAEFGHSAPEILKNLILRPDLVCQRLFTLPNLGYLALLLTPLAWGLSIRHLAPLVAAIPQLGLNLLSPNAAQKDLVHQYSLPILPFLLLVAIASLAAGNAWIQTPRRILLWSLTGFLALSQVHLFGSRYLSTLDTWQASQGAISALYRLEGTAQTPAYGSVLAPAALVPHLTHRSMIKVVGSSDIPLDNYDYLLLNARNPGRMSTPETVNQLVNRARQNPHFQLWFQQDQVYLFSRNSLN